MEEEIDDDHEWAEKAANDDDPKLALQADALLHAFNRIDDPEVRDAILQMVMTLAASTKSKV